MTLPNTIDYPTLADWEMLEDRVLEGLRANVQADATLVALASLADTRLALYRFRADRIWTTPCFGTLQEGVYEDSPHRWRHWEWYPYTALLAVWMNREAHQSSLPWPGHQPRPEIYAKAHARRKGDLAMLVGENAARFIANAMFECPRSSLDGEPLDKLLSRALRRAVEALNRAGISAVS